LLCYARIMESIVSFLIFPIINKIIYVIGVVDEAEIRFHSGLIVCFASGKTSYMLDFG